MRKREEEISSQRRARKPFSYVALGAIFLLAGSGMGVNALVDAPTGTGVNMLGVGQTVHEESGLLSAQVRSDQVVAPETPELVLLNNTSVIATVPPMVVTPKVLGALIGDASLEESSRREILHYEVEQGDTIKSVAEQFGISTNTIVWANDLNNNAVLESGNELVVLPVSGALHLVRSGDTLSEIAVWYQGNVEEILEFNELGSAEDIFVGDFLIIPEGRKPKTLPSDRLIPLANAYFIYPVPRSWQITQGLHPFNAVDFANGTCGGPVYAAAGGMVQKVGYHGVAGNYVRILHHNGVVTFYGHLLGQATSPGERVLQGQIVGYIGHSGHTIPAGPGGCHLHFEVRGATNPFAK